MLDLNLITGFDWDSGNIRKSATKHGVSQAEAEQMFFNDLLLLREDGRHSTAEPRFPALGKTNEGRMLHVTFTLRFDGTKLRIISARDMHKKERMIYGQQT